MRRLAMTRQKRVAFGVVGLLAVVAIAAIFIVREQQATAAAHKEVCIANLRKLERARQKWAADHQNRAGQPIGLREVNEIIHSIEGGDGFMPRCPDNGTYWIEPDGTPTCTWGESRGHKLDAP
jgi:hypothetical protein